MAVARVSLGAIGGAQCRRVAQRLRAQKDLQRRLAESVRKESKVPLRATRAAWRTVEVTSERDGHVDPDYSRQLRRRIGAATGTSPLPLGARIGVNHVQVDRQYGKTLTYGMDGLGRWRHPIFQNEQGTKPWTSQIGREVFYRTLFGFTEHWREGLEQEMEQTVRRIER
jgi:hypothetical protein